MSDRLDIDSQNMLYVERLLEDYLRDPASVPPAWRQYFAELPLNGNGQAARFGPSFQPRSLFQGPAGSSFTPPGSAAASARRADGHGPTNGAAAARGLERGTVVAGEDTFGQRVARLVQAYRARGHLHARLSPLGGERPEHRELNPATYEFTPEDLQRVVRTNVAGAGPLALAKLIERLHRVYCGYIGAQFMHIEELEIREWLQQRMEQIENRRRLSREWQRRILMRLTDAANFEEFVRRKYVGSKTFSLEGAETLIPLLDLAIEKSASQGVAEVVIGMAHRGRLNVLANIIGKPPRDIFREFEDRAHERLRGGGDVKYHLGFSGDWHTQSGANVHLSLCFNPSHLEFVDPVAVGRMRAKQDRVGDQDRRRGMVVLIHGDAAFAGEGVVQETLNLSQLPGYTTGGTLHVIVNNQLGFTTSPSESRSSTYATDVARMLSIPIYHVNGDHPEEVAHVVDIALDFREKFQRDVVIDMYAYRRWGHNETDEPSFTQPRMYEAIEKRERVRDLYFKQLCEQQRVAQEEMEKIAETGRQMLQDEFAYVQEEKVFPEPPPPTGMWAGFTGGREPAEDPKTGIPVNQLADILQRLTETPAGFQVHRKLTRFLDQRRKMAEGKQPLDWASAEALAMATLALEGCPVRLSGQDSERGTFSQRHSVLHDASTGQRYSIFERLAPEQAPVTIINSPLSEAGVLGFEYGYSLDYPDALVMWEAQFGDFWNAAQVIVDQFITSAETKWRRLSGLVLLLPHGFEGQGPEHSSARLERFLTLAVDDNLQVVYPSTPAQYFHCLRRQVKRHWRKPLVVITPKSLLRHKLVVSSLDDLAEGQFQRVIADQREAPAETRRVLLCSGKVYYDLLEARERYQRMDVAILRVEQFYPLAEETLLSALQPYADATPVFWVQEEPWNMASWSYWKRRFGNNLVGRYPFGVVARPPSASPATGSHGAHEREQEDLLKRALEVV